MYNYMRRCLVHSVKNKKLFTQVINDRIAACSNKHCTSTPCFWNDTTCKRFYCQAVVQNVNIPTNPDAENVSALDDQQRLDEFLSNPDNKKLFQVLELEIDVLRHNAEKVPENIKARHWLELLNMRSRTSRKRYLNYLFCNERSRENKKAMTEQKRQEWQAKLAEEKEEEDTDEMKYGLAHNSMFLRIYTQSINNFYHSKLIWGLMFEPKIVLDCGYEAYMNNMENHNCAKQLTLAFAANRIHKNPMTLYYCNLNEKGLLRRNFQRNMPNLLDDDFPAFVTSQSYLDLFPKDQLVYLTPHCREDMIEYDPDMVYIIGAIVDKANSQPLSLAKAKKEGLRMAKLPIDRYLDWGSGSTKNFTLNQVISIMLDLRHTKDWKQALQHIPTRKLKEAREYMLQRKLHFASKFLENKDGKNSFTNPAFSKETVKQSDEIKIPRKKNWHPPNYVPRSRENEDTENYITNPVFPKGTMKQSGETEVPRRENWDSTRESSIESKFTFTNRRRK